MPSVVKTKIDEKLKIQSKSYKQDTLGFTYELDRNLEDEKKESQKLFTFIDLYAGIGGFRIPLEEMGGRCVAFSEIDSTAIDVYRKNFKTDSEIFLGDITKISDIPKADIITGGVPCQSWSVAGKRQGFDDPRGALWFDTIKFVEHSQPKAFIFENVKGLADPRNKESLKLIIKSFEDIGYNVKYKVLNTFDYGLPQSRERIFIVGISKDIKKEFHYPESYKQLPNLSSVIENTVSINSQNVINNNNLKNSFNISFLVNNENFFTFCDTRNGKHSIHSWDLIDTSEEEIQICFAVLKNRRRKIYGDKDGNPLSVQNIQDILKIEGSALESLIDNLNSLVSKNILIKRGEKYDFVNSKNSSGINSIYRVYLPSSHVFSTLTKTGVRDYISEIDIPSEIKDKKNYFIKEIYNKKKFRKIKIREGARIQGFPDTFILPSNYIKSMGLLGNALGVNIVRELVKILVPLITHNYE